MSRWGSNRKVRKVDDVEEGNEEGLWGEEGAEGVYGLNDHTYLTSCKHMTDNGKNYQAEVIAFYK